MIFNFLKEQNHNIREWSPVVDLAIAHGAFFRHINVARGLVFITEPTNRDETSICRVWYAGETGQATVQGQTRNRHYWVGDSWGWRKATLVTIGISSNSCSLTAACSSSFGPQAQAPSRLPSSGTSIIFFCDNVCTLFLPNGILRMMNMLRLLSTKCTAHSLLGFPL